MWRRARTDFEPSGGRRRGSREVCGEEGLRVKLKVCKQGLLGYMRGEFDEDGLMRSVGEENLQVGSDEEGLRGEFARRVCRGSVGRA